MDEVCLSICIPTRNRVSYLRELLPALAREVEANLGITLSIGLGPNKLLAKIASDLDKPRGFARAHGDS